MLHKDALQARVDDLNRRFANADAEAVLKAVLADKILGKTALVSSFGAESAVLLHMVSKVAADTPVLFIDTEFLFPDTLDYLRTLAVQLELTDIRRILPDPGRVAVYDPDGILHQTGKDECCHLRKTLPLNRSLGEFSSWITGRKRFQSATRAELPMFELDKVTNRVKINPLIEFTSVDLRNYMILNNLPPHPLVGKGYPSIGCSPCTTPVKRGEDARAGRWRDEEKVECGIHFADGKMVRLKQGAA